MSKASPTASRPEEIPKPDGRRARGARSREAVLKQAIRIAGAEGLEGLTFGRIAQAAGVPKSTLQVLFKDRETLQVLTLTAAAEAFTAGIRERLPADAAGFERLKGLCDTWFDFVGAGVLPGGCLVTAATAEYRAKPGAIQALANEHRHRWRTALLGAAVTAQQEGALQPGLDLEQLVFEILAFQAAANIKAGQSAATELQRARRGVSALLERAQGVQSGDSSVPSNDKGPSRGPVNKPNPKAKPKPKPNSNSNSKRRRAGG